MEGKTLVRIAILGTCVAVTALGYRNSNGDNSDAVAAASNAACNGQDCSAVLRQTSRGSFGHEYAFDVRQGAAGKGSSRSVIVECKRELILINDWRCAVKPGL